MVIFDLEQYFGIVCLSKIISNYFFSFADKATILDFTNNALSIVVFGYTTRTGLPENPMVHTEIMNLLSFCRICYQFIV